MADGPIIRAAIADDWEAVWINGKKVFEHHRAEWPYLLKQAGLDVETVWAQGQCDDLGGFPATWEEVKPDV